MRNKSRMFKPLAAAVALAAIGGLAAVPGKADAPPNYSIQYGGLFDGYYLYQFNNPKTGNLGLRFYDFRHNTPTLALGELNVFKVSKPGDLGFKVTLGSGDIATINGGGGDEGRFQSLMQAYGTWYLPKGAGVDFGKFYTPIGYELTESNGNMNETHSIPFNFIPFYHSGIRYYTPSMNGLVVTLYLVRAVYNTSTAGVQDDNGTPAFVGSAFWTDPKGKWVIGESLGLGKDKFNLFNNGPFGDGLPEHGPNNKVTVSDTDLTYNLNPKETIAGDFTYARTDPDSNDLGVTKATDTGWAVYFKQVLTPKSDVALRYSGGKQEVDTQPADPNVEDSTPTPIDTVKPWEVTATWEMHPAANFTERLEYQHSHANEPLFVDSDGNATKHDQDTLEVAGIFTF